MVSWQFSIKFHATAQSRLLHLPVAFPFTVFSIYSISSPLRSGIGHTIPRLSLRETLGKTPRFHRQNLGFLSISPNYPLKEANKNLPTVSQTHMFDG
jgi:hypothetical protein